MGLEDDVREPSYDLVRPCLYIGDKRTARDKALLQVRVHLFSHFLANTSLSASPFIPLCVFFR